MISGLGLECLRVRVSALGVRVRVRVRVVTRFWA